jgi:hypothetical protein
MFGFCTSGWYDGHYNINYKPSYGRKEYEENITPKSSADELYLQRAGKKISAMEISQVSLQNIRISDKLDTQGSKNAKPIWCDASLVITECKSQNKSISVRGEATVKCLCQGEDGCITFVKSFSMKPFVLLLYVKYIRLFDLYSNILRPRLSPRSAMNGFCVELCCSYCKSYDDDVVLCMNTLNENVFVSTLYNVIAKSMCVSWLKSFAMQEMMFVF